jgi:hypothetical protein
VYDPRLELGTGRWTLTGLSGEFAFYSAAVLQSLGLTFDPVALFWEEGALPAAEAPLALAFDRTVLAGPAAPLDRTIFACPKPYAPRLFTFLDRFAARLGSVVYESVHQRLPVVDWRLLDRVSVAPARAPTVVVELYGLSGPTDAVYWRPPADPWTAPVQLVRRVRPREEPARDR